MSKMENDKYFALIEEFETSKKLIDLGFGELQNISLSNNFYFLPFQLLSQGFERFLKAYICLKHFEQYDTFPLFKEIKDKLGHDLEKLLKEILKKYYTKDSRVQFVCDDDFLKNDKEFKELLSIISEFGKFGRYYNFDVITGKTKIDENPKVLWEQYEGKIMKQNNVLEKLTNPDLSDEFYQSINKHIIVIFEKFVSALSRQLTFSGFGELSNQMTFCALSDFSNLHNDDFGDTDYRIKITK